MQLHPDTLTALGKLRAEDILREAEEWQAVLLAIESIPRHQGAVTQALAWWRFYLRRGRADRSPLAEPEES